MHAVATMILTTEDASGQAITVQIGSKDLHDRAGLVVGAGTGVEIQDAERRRHHAETLWHGDAALLHVGMLLQVLHPLRL